ncbi:MAG: biotin/lipoyl-containing protein, partial [Roseibium sp.]
MPINITMPALSPTMEEGNLAKWLVKEGDTVSAGDVIAEIETDKATMEVEAVDEGKVGKIVVPEGTNGVKVNELIAVLLEDGEDASAIGSAPAAPAAPESASAPAAEAPVAAAPASAAPAGPAPKAADGNRIFSSPLARRLAQQGGLELTAISGSGPHGRIVKRDVEAAIASGTGKAAAAPAADAPKAAASAMPSGPSSDQVLKLFEDGSYDLVPHDGMRKTIAKRLQE